MIKHRCTQPSKTINALMERFPILNQLFDNPNRRRTPSTCPICGRRLQFQIIRCHGANYTVRHCPHWTPKAAA